MMRQIMDFVFHPAPGVGQGAKAKEQARKHLAEAVAKNQQVDAVTSSLRGYRERNHLAEQIEIEWRKKTK